MLESALESYFRSQVLKRGGRSYKLAPTHKGLPDRMVLWPGGKIELVELKTETGHLSPAQQLLHERFAALGTVVRVLYGRADVDSYLEEK